MIHEEICTYEVCKLAKEKGFSLPCLYHFDKNGNLKEHYDYDADNSGIGVGELLRSKVGEEDYLAPTQSLLQRWLREEKGVIIVLEYSDNTEDWRPFWSWIVYDKLGFTIEIGDNHDTYELALEDALKYALEILI